MLNLLYMNVANVEEQEWKMNKKRKYKIVNVETGKILKYGGRLQYFRTKSFAKMEKIKLEKELPIKLKIVEKEWKKKTPEEQKESLLQE